MLVPVDSVMNLKGIRSELVYQRSLCGSVFVQRRHACCSQKSVRLLLRGESSLGVQHRNQSHHTFTSQYTQQGVIAAGELESRDILVGEAAEQALSGSQGPSPN